MKYDWEEMLDRLEEKDLIEFLPETLPEMDEVTRKRIEKRTLQKIRKERNRFSRKQIVAVLICLVAVLGIAGREPIQAAFERLFHYLSGAGMYVDEEGNTLYEAEIVNGEFTENDIHVRLKNVYAENHTVNMEVEMTGDLLELTQEAYEPDSKDKYEQLEEMYAVTIEYDGKQDKLTHGNKGALVEDKDNTYVITRYRRDYQRYVKNAEQTYVLHIAGFENALSFRLTANTGKEQPENIGASQTKNGITVTAGAEVTEEGIWFEYYVLSEEILAETDQTHRFIAVSLPYEYFQWNDVPEAELYQRRYVMNRNGEMLYPKGLYFHDNLENGKRILYEGTAEDFPLTFYQAAFTGVGGERGTIEIPVPETSEELAKTIDFPYGTVTLEQIQTKPGNENGIKELEIIYRIQPKEGKRKMYGVFMQVQEAVQKEANELTIFPEEDGTYHFPAKISTETKEITLELYDPYYWIVDDYTLVIEAPNETK